MANEQENNQETVKRILPKQAFDREYMTDWLREVKYLTEKGFRWAYVKKTNYGISQYKYQKTPELFKALAEFYEKVSAEKATLASMDEVVQTLKSAGIELERGENGNFKFVKPAAKEECCTENDCTPRENKEDDTE